MAFMEKATDANISYNDMKVSSINTCIVLLLGLGMTVNGYHKNHCSAEKQVFSATENRKLKTSTIWSGKVTSPIRCVSYCHADPNCQSVNFLKVDRLCQLNNVSKVVFPDNLITDYTSNYYDGESSSHMELLKADQNSDCSMTSTSVTEAVSSITESGEVWTEQELSVVGKPSKQSSSYYEWSVAGRANDGETNVFMETDPYCSHTEAEFHAWWRVDLGGEHLLGRITVVNRGDCCANRLAGATVRAGLSPEVLDNKMCGSKVSRAQAEGGGWIEFSCDPRTLARYVSVDHIKGYREVLQICEVMVKEYVRIKPC